MFIFQLDDHEYFEYAYEYGRDDVIMFMRYIFSIYVYIYIWSWCHVTGFAVDQICMSFGIDHNLFILKINHFLPSVKLDSAVQ